MRLIWADRRPIAEVWETLRTRGLDPAHLGLSFDGHERITRRFPAIIDGQGRFVQEAFDFLFDVAFIQGSTRSGRTLETYAESLLSWLSFAEQNGLAWATPRPSMLAAFRNHMLGTQGSEYREKPLKRRTVNLRITVALEFYRYLGWIDRLAPQSQEFGQNWNRRNVPPETISVKRRSSSAFERLRVEIYKKRPKAIPEENCTALCRELPNPHRLIWQWMLCTGLRIGSVVRIPLASFQALLTTSAQAELTVQAKGGKMVSVPVQHALRESTAAYIEVGRRLALGCRKHPPSEPLFVNARGAPVTEKAFYRALRRAGARLGLAVHPHQARATFATRLRDGVKRLRSRAVMLDPVKVVQYLLGHANPQTTEDYLESIDVPSEDILHMLDELAAPLLDSREEM